MIVQSQKWKFSSKSGHVYVIQPDKMVHWGAHTTKVCFLIHDVQLYMIIR